MSGLKRTIFSPCGVANQSNSVRVLFWKTNHQDVSLAVIEKEMPKFYGFDLIGVCSKHWKNIHGHFADDDKDDN